MNTERANNQQQDQDASELLANMEPRLRRFLGNLARREVEDLVQETWARAWRSRKSLDADRGNGEAWLLRIAFRAFIDHRRLGRRSLGVSSAPPETACGQRGPAQVAAIREHTTALLAELSDCERAVLLRFHREGQSIERIASAMAMPHGTVKSHLHRARSKLWALEQAQGDNR